MKNFIQFGRSTVPVVLYTFQNLACSSPTMTWRVFAHSPAKSKKLLVSANESGSAPNAAHACFQTGHQSRALESKQIMLYSLLVDVSPQRTDTLATIAWEPRISNEQSPRVHENLKSKRPPEGGRKARTDVRPPRRRYRFAKQIVLLGKPRIHQAQTSPCLFRKNTASRLFLLSKELIRLKRLSCGEIHSPRSPKADLKTLLLPEHLKNA